MAHQSYFEQDLFIMARQINFEQVLFIFFFNYHSEAGTPDFNHIPFEPSTFSPALRPVYNQYRDIIHHPKAINIFNINDTFYVFVNKSNYDDQGRLDDIYFHIYGHEHRSYQTIKCLLNKDKKVTLLNIESKDPILRAMATNNINKQWYVNIHIVSEDDYV